MSVTGLWDHGCVDLGRTTTWSGWRRSGERGGEGGGGGYPMAWWNIDEFYISHGELCIRNSRNEEIAGNHIIVQSIRVQHQTTEFQRGIWQPFHSDLKERQERDLVLGSNVSTGPMAFHSHIPIIVPDKSSNPCHRSGLISIYLGKGCSI